MKQQPKKQPIARPNSAELNRAWNIVDDWFLHFYQLLFFHEPTLTSPGYNGHPFNVKRDPKHHHCAIVERVGYPEFNFSILPDTKDEEVIERCNLILKADPARRVHRMACCALAEYRNCVCAYSFSCPIHGDMCIGSHD